MQSFVQAVHQKYATNVTHQLDGPSVVTFEKEHVISGKVAQEIGFDKIRKQQSQLAELKIVIVDGMRISATSPRDVISMSIRETCPKILELDLSRNLFEGFNEIVQICGELDFLHSLKIKYVKG